MSPESRAIGAIAALVMLGASWAPAVAQESVQAGVSAAVRGDVQLARGNLAVGRRIDSGEPIYLEDSIRSGADSGMQVLLLDETVFTIGPNSEMSIDSFVYDPTTGAGQVAASVTKGVFRFVTGKVAQTSPDKMSVSTPLGTIGIRGTIVGGAITPQRAEIILLGPGSNHNTPENSGAITVSNTLGAVDIERTGFGTVLLPNAPPSVPDVGDVSALLRSLRPTVAGQSTQAGGADDGSTSPADAGDMQQAGSQSGQNRAQARSISDVIQRVQIKGEESRKNSEDVATANSGIGAINSIAELNTGTGQFHFSDTGNLTDGGSYSIAVDLDFDSRTIGGGNSGVTVSPSSFSGGTFSILSNAFSSGSNGQAVFDGQNNINFTCGANTCNGAVSMTFRDLDNQVAGAMTHEVTVTNSNTNQTVSGSGTDTTRGSGLSP